MMEGNEVPPTELPLGLIYELQVLCHTSMIYMGRST